MEELLEMITWSQLGIHKKPVLYLAFTILYISMKMHHSFFDVQLFVQIGLLNVDGYYNSLLALFDTGVEEGFIKPSARDIILSAPSAKELLIQMEVHTIFQMQLCSVSSLNLVAKGSHST